MSQTRKLSRNGVRVLEADFRPNRKRAAKLPRWQQQPGAKKGEPFECILMV
jgi:hypothetical protein